MISHIGVSVIVDAVGRGMTFRTPINSVQMGIGKQLEDQAFIEMMSIAKPYYFKKLQKWYLHDSVRRYDRKIGAMKNSLHRDEDLTYEFMSHEDLLRVGALVLRAVMSIPCCKETGEGFFERRNVSKAKKKDVGYLAYSKTGLLYRDKLQEMVDALIYKPEPMLCPPMPWSETERGGFLLQPPQPYGDLIHSHNPTKPSQTALDALNRLQSQPFRINPFILEVQTLLLDKSYEIGSFRTFEADSWKDQYFPRFNSDHIDSLDKEGDEYKQVMRELTAAYHQQKVDEKKAINPRRIVLQAQSLKDEVFWTPYFFDSRLRLYPATELGCTGGDFVKALLVTAKPLPITEDTRRELLIAIATSGDFGKVSKQDYYARLEWAEEFIKTPEFRECVADPVGASYWKEADEPFQFLSYCEEYNALFITEERDTTRVFIGRDASCSGIQILSSVIGDLKAMEYTNVLPSDAPKDAYGEVARVARELLRDPAWLKDQIEGRQEKDEAWNKKNPDRLFEPRSIFEFDPDLLDRSILKTSVMVTGYGGTYRSKRDYILEGLDEKGVEIHPADRSIVINACIQGMNRAFPEYKQLNDWFKQMAKAACEADLKHILWMTPNGSLIAQDYRECLMQQVKTHAASGGHYAQVMQDDQGTSYTQVGWGDVQPSKHGSAIAANFTHALDACIIQNGVSRLPDDISIFCVHDCLYVMPGYQSAVSPIFRQAFYGVVSSPVLEDLLEQNGLEDQLTLPPRHDVDLSVCKDSPYLFS